MYKVMKDAMNRKGKRRSLARVGTINASGGSSSSSSSKQRSPGFPPSTLPPTRRLDALDILRAVLLAVRGRRKANFRFSLRSGGSTSGRTRRGHIRRRRQGTRGPSRSDGTKRELRGDGSLPSQLDFGTSLLAAAGGDGLGRNDRRRSVSLLLRYRRQSTLKHTRKRNGTRRMRHSTFGLGRRRCWAIRWTTRGRGRGIGSRRSMWRAYRFGRCI